MAAEAARPNQSLHLQVKRLAAKHRVGFFDVSSNGSDIWLPTPDGGLERSNE